MLVRHDAWVSRGTQRERDTRVSVGRRNRAKQGEEECASAYERREVRKK